MIDKWGNDTSPAASLLPAETQATTTRAKQPTAKGDPRAKLLTMGQKSGK